MAKVNFEITTIRTTMDVKFEITTIFNNHTHYVEIMLVQYMFRLFSYTSTRTMQGRVIPRHVGWVFFIEYLALTKWIN